MIAITNDIHVSGFDAFLLVFVVGIKACYQYRVFIRRMMVFKIAVFGDSVTWGQGLEDHQKYSALVENYLRVRVFDSEIQRIIFAHSGAILGIERQSILPAIDQEVPVDDPTIFQQVIQFRESPAESEDIRLVIINGGINDINVRNILDPTTSVDSLRNQTGKYCFNDMLTLLSECNQVFPYAKIIVTGYYPLVSIVSPTIYLSALATSVGLVLATISGAIVLGAIANWAHLRMTENCLAFAQSANQNLNSAVIEMNRLLLIEGRESKFAFADPNYQAENAFMAPQSLLFGVRLNLDPTEPFLPVDTISRVTACHTAKDNGRIADYAQCKIASLGHPNPMGAQRYFDVISPILDQWILDGWNPVASNNSLSWMLLLLSKDVNNTINHNSASLLPLLL